jgi:hypothetical protein
MPGEDSDPRVAHALFMENTGNPAITQEVVRGRALEAEAITQCEEEHAARGGR